MSTSKRPPTYGDAPPRPGSRTGAPLPLVTNPMMPVQPQPQPIDESGGHTRIDNPMARIDNPMARREQATSVMNPEPAALLFGKSTMALAQVAKPPVIMASGPPPQIDLTQHHLPDERPDARLTLVIDPDSERAAQFRVLRHHLLELGRPQVVVVSSPGNGDGKTTTALNLALALAECGRAKVLLAEAHVRRPQLAQILRFVPPWCFAEQLVTHRNQPMMPWSIVDIPSMWLHIGAINPRIDKAQLLDGPAFDRGMERLRAAGYDHIVIDAPPVLGSADVNLMADSADTVLLAVRSRRSTARDLRRAIEQLGASKVVGTVLVE